MWYILGYRRVIARSLPAGRQVLRRSNLVMPMGLPRPDGSVGTRNDIAV